MTTNLEKVHWQAFNNGTGRRRWFLCRPDPTIPLADRFRLDSRGNLVRYKTYESASAAADRLNERGPQHVGF